MSRLDALTRPIVIGAAIALLSAGVLAATAELSGQAGSPGADASPPGLGAASGLSAAGSTVSARAGAHLTLGSDLSLAGTSAALSVSGTLIAESSGDSVDEPQLHLRETHMPTSDMARLTLGGASSTVNSYFWTLAADVPYHHALNVYRQASAVGDNIISISDMGVADLCMGPANGCTVGVTLPIQLRSQAYVASVTGSVVCEPEEIALGGGCAVTSASRSIKESMSSPVFSAPGTAGAATGWTCSPDASSNFTVYAICLRVSP